MRFRQVHLDFHTSPCIENIGGAFDRQEWQAALKAGHVNSITCFSKCHHGWSYHPTKVGRMHPHLKFDLLRAQFDACKEMDVNVPVYLSAGVDNMASQEHPEWREVNANGAWGPRVIDAGFHKMCFNSPYLEYLCRQIREAAELFPNADGIFLDIIHQGQCCCRWCLDVMHENGLSPEVEADRKKCAKFALDRYYCETTAACLAVRNDMPVFHNSGHIPRGRRDILKYVSHLELESLPTGGWGYDHFPLSAKYCKKLDLDVLGMTGKFHTTWGEFGGFKHPNALRYECAAMLAYGAKCSVGDQLHPEGKMDSSTYATIGAGYEEVEAKEAWCVNAEPVADVGLLSSEAVRHSDRTNHPDAGASRVLLEGHFLFDVLDADMDFTPYKALVLPDDILVDKALKKKLDTYLAGGGKLLLTGESGLDPEKKKFVFDIGAKFDGPSPFQPDYILPVPELQPEFLHTPLVMYLRSQRIRATNGTALGDVHDPYFNRKWDHFCSHQHTPNQPQPSGFHCGVRNGNIVYLAHPVFTIYRGYGAVAYRDYAVKALDLLLGKDRSLRTNLPSTARVSLMRQPAETRAVLHLLYANTVARGGQITLPDGTNTGRGGIEVIEELLPLHDVAVEVKVPGKFARVTLEPQGIEIPFSVEKGRIRLCVEEFTCHQMVVLHYGTAR
ncbi:MAG: hypothetical protein A3K18_12410 [Lentisphaerae bacterium RIFOXYA12_64_32]|nr:MAG: hypothetical protein A3K18_12410 [Lentisphaerae bacterium RIFOXYA12_64_32]